MDGDILILTQLRSSKTLASKQQFVHLNALMISEAFLASFNVRFIEEKVNCHIDWFLTHGSHYVLFISIGTTLAKEYQT